MDLFKLFGTIAINNSEANEGIDETTGKAEKAHPRIANAFSKIGSAAVKAGKAIATGLAAGSAAVGAIAKQALDSYSDYEQLVGGVQTLFGAGGKSIEEYAASVGKSVDEAKAEFDQLMIAENQVLENAQNAFSSAGMSANEYMETVTSFSASLLQGLDGDTVKAAEIANKAITDMSDNANKMGTDIGMIQNAYQGFAKQNYTMLDNLKLGYGGTQAEMARLINDSGVLGDSMVVTAETVNQVSFHKIIEAIGVVQDEIGITGTTAREAATTIQGSLAATKSAWQNLLTGFADGNQDLSVLINNLVVSGTTAVKNIVPRLAQILSGISAALPQIMVVISAELPALVEALLPGLIQGASALLVGLVSALPEILQVLIAQVPNIISMLGKAFSDAFPALIDSFGEMFSQLIPGLDGETIFSGVGELFSSLKESMGSVFSELSTTLFPVMVDMINQIVPLITNLAQTVLPPIVEIIGKLIPPIAQIVQTLMPVFTTLLQTLMPIVQKIFDFLQPILNVVISLIAPIADLIAKAITPLIEILGKLLGGIIDGVSKAWNWMVETFSKAANWYNENVIGPVSEFFSGLWDGIKEGVSAAWNWIVETFSKAASWYNEKVIEPVSGFFSGLWDGIKEGVVGAWNKIKEIWGGITNWFDQKIVKPISNLFTKLWTGIKEAFKKPINWIIDGINKFIRGINKIKIPDWVPLVGGKGFHINELPRLEKGGVLEKGQVGLLEGKGAEAVVPLDRNSAWINAVARDMETAGIGGGNVLTHYFQELIDMLSDFFPQLLDAAGHDIVTNDGLVIAHYAPLMNSELGKITTRKDRGR